jgi:hypothetical protein
MGVPLYVRTEKPEVQYVYFSFQDDMNMLAKIPVIPALLETAEDEATAMAMAQVSDSPLQEAGEMTRSERNGDQRLDGRGGEGDSCQQVQQSDQPVTLLQWISAKNRTDVYQVAQSSVRDLEQVCSVTVELLVLDNEKLWSEPW